MKTDTAKEKILGALVVAPGTAKEIAAHLKIGYSTTTRHLRALVAEGFAQEIDGRKFRMAGHRVAAPEPPAALIKSSAGGPSELEMRIAGYLARVAGPASPYEIGKALKRSAGAVANACERMDDVRLANKKPRRYVWRPS